MKKDPIKDKIESVNAEMIFSSHPPPPKKRIKLASHAEHVKLIFKAVQINCVP